MKNLEFQQGTWNCNNNLIKILEVVDIVNAIKNTKDGFNKIIDTL